MSYRIAKAAQKALSLDQDGASRLLVIMAFLLCWVVALGAAGVAGLNSVYQQWRLNQQSQVTVYVLPDTEKEALDSLVSRLDGLLDVRSVTVVPHKEVRALLQPYFQNDQAFPLPEIVQVEVMPVFDRDAFDAVVAEEMPTAEIDDNRDMLQAVARLVRLAQGAIFSLAVVLMLVTGFLVVLTVRVGLKSQRRALAILQFLGGSDRYVAHLVVRQMFARTLLGWAFGSLVAAGCVVFAGFWWPVFIGLWTPTLWLSLFGVPLLLPFMAWGAAHVTALSVVQRGA